MAITEYACFEGQIVTSDHTARPVMLLPSLPSMLTDARFSCTPFAHLASGLASFLGGTPAAADAYPVRLIHER
jgi:hypothetical protein